MGCSKYVVGKLREYVNATFVVQKNNPAVIKKINDHKPKVRFIVRHKSDFIQSLSNLLFSSVVSCNLFQEATDRKHLFINLFFKKLGGEWNNILLGTLFYINNTLFFTPTKNGCSSNSRLLLSKYWVTSFVKFKLVHVCGIPLY